MTQTSLGAVARRGRAHPLAWLVAVLVAGVVVFLPSLRSPYILDDHWHAAMVAGRSPLVRGPFDLYRLIDEAERPLLWARGMIPWWTDPHLSIRFLRPLSSALIFAEHKLLGDGPLLLHAHSFAWWIAVVLGAHALLSDLLPARPARLATAIFALSPCHAVPLGWLANREVLVTAAFGWPALRAYVRFRERGAVRDAALAAALFCVALSAGEYTLCLAGYVVALEVWRRDGFGERVLGLAPFAVPAALYVALRSALGYGARGSGFYTDPLREPWTFLRAMPRRLVTLLLDGWFSLDGDTVTSALPWWSVALFFGAALVALAAPILRLHAQLEPTLRARARWLLLGSLLAVGPVTAVSPSPRVLGVGMLGVAATVALLLDRAWLSPAPEGASAAHTGADPPAGLSWLGRLPRTLAAEHTLFAALVLGFAHLVHAPVTSYLVGRELRRNGVWFGDQVDALRSRTSASGKPAAEVVVMRGSNLPLFYAWTDERTEVHPWRVLAQAGHVLALTRGPRSVELRAPTDGGVIPVGGQNLFRGEGNPIREGERFEVPGMRVTVLDVGPAGPRRVLFELDRDLDADSLLWVAEDHTGLADAPPPAVGFGKPFDP